LAEAVRFVRGGAKNESPGWRVDQVTVNLEHRMAAQHKKELLVSTGVVLIMLVNDPIARGARRPSSHSEGRDAQVMPDWPIVTACIAEFLDLVQMRNRVISHGLVLPLSPTTGSYEPDARYNRSSTIP
jgi:hypothetical protein